MAREYYFDESQGVSLQDHISDIKRTRGVKVETWTDKDGYVIIRKSFEKEYSFNLDQMMEFDQEKEEQDLLVKLNEQAKLDGPMTPEWIIADRQQNCVEPHIATELLMLVKNHLKGEISESEYSQEVKSLIGENHTQSDLQDIFLQSQNL